MKNKCPNCASKRSLGSRWTNGRQLQYYCYDCIWNSDPQTPPQKEIQTVRCAPAQNEWNYEIYDRYGWVMYYSRSYCNEEEATRDLQKQMERGKEDKIAGPYTGVLFPVCVDIQGKLFQ